ncbi:boophilin-G2 [Gouania willdenowi]|uniref:Boophilin-G2-like n=1 Tax=Gouania willdenowi TaxID=441366 RepID=A0A8C5N1F0_GOUWI|nr:boophilin-G2-like [Gouania willdenowi]
MKHLLLLGIVFSVLQITYSVPAFCFLKHDEGQGLKFNFASYYDPEKDQCYPFIYKGEGGNDNRFEHERDCIRNCSQRAEEIYPMDASKVCYLKKDMGGCESRILRYYYDPIHDKCKKFLYTGCIGNGNRFTDYESCNATCDGIHEDGDEEEEDEPDTPIAIICGVLIGIVVFAVIITVIVLTVQSQKKKSKKKGAGKSKDHQSDSPLQDREIEMS